MRQSSFLFGLLFLVAVGFFLGREAEARPDEWLGAAPEPGALVVVPLARYEVAAGDTLYRIAARYGVEAERIAAANSLSLNDPIYVGQFLTVPADGLTYRVVPGDTLWDIAQRYGVPLAELLKANGLAADMTLLPGTELVVPRAPGGGLAASDLLGWPVIGPISSPFGLRDERPHEGMDIAVPAGTPVRAAADGQVIYAGPAGAYGLLVILPHRDTCTTHYAHCSEIYVVRGEQVTAGQVIAAVGDTGRSTGPHLHFEVRLNGTPYDPADFLP
uniref:M23 family metallopeptidase n=1 Tax=Ammonifex degensii TaxID=42838 RepID=A0A7C2E3K7_9THEO